MGLFGFGTVMLGAFQAGWYGNAATPLIIWPFAMGEFLLFLTLTVLTGASAVTAARFYTGSLANMPGAKVTDPIAYPAGVPGVKVGH